MKTIEQMAESAYESWRNSQPFSDKYGSFLDMPPEGRKAWTSIMAYIYTEALDEHRDSFPVGQRDVINNANEHFYKKPNLSTLMEEVAEAILASRGKHEHPLRLELVQIAGICINIIRQIDAGAEFRL